MDMNAAYREVGSYRAAAQLCGTTPKTVKRAVLAAESGPEVSTPQHNYDDVRLIVAQRVDKTKGLISAKRSRPVTSAARSKSVSLTAPSRSCCWALSWPNTPWWRPGKRR